MSNFPLSRNVLGACQGLGWLISAGLVCLGAYGTSQGQTLPGITLIAGALMGGGINHAVMAIGLAIFDLVDGQREQIGAAQDSRNLLREVLGVLKLQNRKIDEQATPPQPPQPMPVKIPKDGTTLLEPAAQVPAPSFKPLVVAGDVPPLKPLGEDDIERLEAERRKRGNRL